MMNSWWMVALALGGCAVDKMEGISVYSGEIDCDPLVCPGNSDLLGLLGPYELDQTGAQVSSRGWRITDVKLKGGTVTGFHVAGATLHAADADGPKTGAGLAGLQLTLQHTGTDGGQTVELQVIEATDVLSYAGVPNHHVQGFHVNYNIVGGARGKLCPYSTSDQGITDDWVVFWKGDRLDPVTGQIFASDSAVGPWFNLSCAGEAPIKMLRAGAGGAVAPGSPVDQRQATLNMFTASYCGATGRRYTRLGQRLAWTDVSSGRPIGTVSSYEAVWTAGVAACLGTPRMVDRSEVQCEIPICSRSMIENWQSAGWLLSGNPPPQQ
jgi:hypothetical protein